MADMPIAGWYPDPAGDSTRLRWWDGTQWTDTYTAAFPPNGQTSSAAANSVQGQAIVTAQQQGYSQQQAYGSGQQAYGQQQTYAPASSKDDSLLLAAFVLCVISCVVQGTLIIPLAWCVPMTVHMWRIYKGERPNTTAFAVCTLIFLNTIGGVLLLVAGTSR